MAKITISEGLGVLKSLKTRHNELMNLRNQNSTNRMYRDTNEVVTPEYNFKELDKKVAEIAKEIRVLDRQIKRSNSQTFVPEYEYSDDVMDFSFE